MTVHVTIELTEDQKARLESLAAFKQVSVSQYLVDLAENNAHHDADFRALVQDGLDEADRGELVDHADVMVEVEALIAASEARKAGWRARANASFPAHDTWRSTGS